MLNPRRLEQREKKSVGFSEPVRISTIIHHDETPQPMPRSSSMGGLSTLAKSVTKQQEQVDDLSTMIEHVKEIIAKYEHEIKELQADNIQRDTLIKKYEERYSEIEKSINDIWNS